MFLPSKYLQAHFSRSTPFRSLTCNLSANQGKQQKTSRTQTHVDGNLVLVRSFEVKVNAHASTTGRAKQVFAFLAGEAISLHRIRVSSMPLNIFAKRIHCENQHKKTFSVQSEHAHRGCNRIYNTPNKCIGSLCTRDTLPAFSSRLTGELLAILSLAIAKVLGDEC